MRSRHFRPPYHRAASARKRFAVALRTLTPACILLAVALAAAVAAPAAAQAETGAAAGLALSSSGTPVRAIARAAGKKAATKKPAGKKTATKKPAGKKAESKSSKTPVKAEDTLVIEGAGDGHGVGMSQWGALGYAEHGWSASAILGHYYTGTALGHVSKTQIVKVLVGNHVEKVPIEAYVRGVVSAEMPASWPAAALEAQAIASRTYALTDDAGGSRFDVYSDTRSQVYLGKAAETPQTNAAVKATAGEVVTYDGQPAITYFFASSGGMTEDIQNVFLGSIPEPWLTSVADPYDGGPLHRWKASVGFARAARQLSGLVKGSFEGIEVRERGISPRVLSADVLGSKGSTEVSGPDLAERLGLYSTWVYFSVLSPNGKVKAEPDSSGQQRPAEAAPEEAPPSEATPAETASPEAGSSGGTTPEAQAGGGASAP